MKKLLLLSFFVLSLKIASSQLYFKNNSSKPVYVAYAMQNNNKNNKAWYSQGWYSVDPGGRIQLSSAVGLNPNVYWFAKSHDQKSEWNGKNRDNSASFLVSSEAFNIKNANLQYVLDQNPSYYWKSFRHIKIGTFQTKYTIEITD